ncbi:MAG: PIN domain-containing protein [Corynebacterium sp.]|nr:PIN domain-containing protein [Corynebacterium sp.]
MAQRVFVDANILFSKTLMDWLFLLRNANEGMFQVHTTEDVIAEVISNFRKRTPRRQGYQTKRRSDLIRASLDEIVPDFPDNLAFSGVDEDDYHVHAAATQCQADFLLTQNKPTDFTSSPHHEAYEIITADDFFVLVVDSNPASLKYVTQAQLGYWAGSKKTLDQALVDASCPHFARRVEYEVGQLQRLPEIGRN